MNIAQFLSLLHVSTSFNIIMCLLDIKFPIGIGKISLLLLQQFATNQINPAYMWEFFVEKDMPYNLRTKVLCRLPQAQANRYGIDSLSFRASLLWNTLKDEVKRTGTLTKFKKSIVKWDGKSCSYFNGILSALLSVFRQGCSTQHALFRAT